MCSALLVHNRAVLSLASTMPPPPSPEAFGQHLNAEISYLIEDSRALLDGLGALQPRSGTAGGGGAGGLRREEAVAAITADLLDQVGTGGESKAPAELQWSQASAWLPALCRPHLKPWGWL
jgi:hypothetical protein